MASETNLRAIGTADRPARPFCVLQVLPSLELGGGGVERSTLDVARALVEAGHRSLVASAGGPLVEELTRSGAQHFELPLAAKSLLTIRANVRRLGALIDDYGVDIVHARSRAPAWSAMSAARRAGVRYLTTFHGTYNFAGRLKHKYNSVMAQGDLVIANSEFIADHIRAHYAIDPGRIRVVPRGIDLAWYDRDTVAAERVRAVAETWRVKAGVPVVLLPGRLTRWKGQELLVDALARVGVRPLQGLLVGADQGRGRYRRHLEARIRDRGLADVVRVVGHCDDMPAAYLLADVVVSASTDPEAFGRVIAEAQAMGRPVVVADHGGGAEQVVDGKTGWLFRVGDAADLAAKIERALALDAGAREALAARAIDRVRDRYGGDRMCAATLSVYRELMAQA